MLTKTLEINLELNYFCTLDCKYCYMKDYPDWQNKDKYITLNQIKKLKTYLSLLKLKYNLKIMGGEPTEHPDFIDIVKLLINNNIEIYTNGLFNQKILDFLRKNNIRVNFSLHLKTLQDKKKFDLFKKNFYGLDNKFLNIILFDKKYDNQIHQLLKSDTQFSINSLHDTKTFKTKNFLEKIRKSDLFNFKLPDNNLKIICYYPKINITPLEINIPRCFSPTLAGKYKFDINIFHKLMKLKEIPKKVCNECIYLNKNDFCVIDYFKPNQKVNTNDTNEK